MSTTVSAGSSGDFTIPAGRTGVFTTTGEGLVRIKTGASGAGFDTRRATSDKELLIGPFGNDVVVTIIGVAGSTTGKSRLRKPAFLFEEDSVVAVDGLGVGVATRRNRSAAMHSTRLDPSTGLLGSTCHWVSIEPAPFAAIRAHILNAASVQQTGLAVKVAASSNVTDPNNPNADANWRSVLFGGASTGSTPVAVSAAGTADVVLAVLSSDITPCQSIARTDGAGYIAMGRLWQPSAGNTANCVCSGGPAAADFVNYDLYTGGIYADRVSTTAGGGWSPLTSGTPLVLEFFYTQPVISVLAAGDSITMGNNGVLGPGGVWGAFRIAAKSLQAAGVPVKPINAGASGMGSLAYFVNGKNMLALYKPQAAALVAWSPNDADKYSAAGVERCLSQAVQWVQLCNDNAVVPMLVTPAPVSGINAAQEAFRRQVCDGVRAMCASAAAILVDRDSVYTDYSTTSGGYKTGLNFDSVHPNAAGYSAEALVWASAIAKLA